MARIFKLKASKRRHLKSCVKLKVLMWCVCVKVGPPRHYCSSLSKQGRVRSNFGVGTSITLFTLDGIAVATGDDCFEVMSDLKDKDRARLATRSLAWPLLGIHISCSPSVWGLLS